MRPRIKSGRVNVRQVVEHIESVIKRKQDYLKTLKPRTDPTDQTMTEIVKFSIQELNEILDNCKSALEADELKDREIRRLERLNSNYTWQLYSRQEKA